MTGRHLVAGEWEIGTGREFSSYDPRTGQPSGRKFLEAGEAQVDRSVSGSAAHVRWEGFAPADVRGRTLQEIAVALDIAEAEIVAVADRESGLGTSRLTGELARTTGQLRAFADALADGYHLDRVSDRVADGTRFLRLNVPIGPVVVFEASNFPLAFATMGGDTAAALAAGCPVVVKAHPDHPETSELVGRIALDVLMRYDLGGVLSVVHGPSPELGAHLVQHPLVAAVGFTGSLRGGRALFDLAADRPSPIPVYAEMGSVNPLIVTEAAAVDRAEEIAEGYAGSLLLGSGQFCTKPGLLVVPTGDAGDRLVGAVSAAVAAAEPQILLDERIRASYIADFDELRLRGRVLAGGASEGDGFRVGAALVEVEADPGSLDEVFGPLGLVYRYRSLGELTEFLAALPGALAAAIHAGEHDTDARAVLSTVTMKVGRVIWNGYPTGVAVTPAMMHGGPYPATSEPLHTSVGLSAMRRFQRPVTFQNVPEKQLAASLQSWCTSG